MTELRLDDAGAVSLRADQIAGVSLAVLGITGSGKTNSVAVIAEELLARQVPLTFLDLEGEFWSLKERFQVLVVGRSEHADIEVGPEHAADLARLSVERGLTVILDFSGHEEEDDEAEEIAAFLLPYIKALWSACFKAKRTYVVAVEEAHEFIPQVGRTPLKSWLNRIAARGRKRGLSLILSSQRSAQVDKNALSQCRLRVLHKVELSHDLDVYKTLIPWHGREVEQRVGALQQGEAIVVVEGQQAQTVRMRARNTFHPSATPTLETAEPVELQAVDAALLAELRHLLATPHPAYLNREERARLEHRIKQLEAEKQRLEGEVERLRAQVAAQQRPPIGRGAAAAAHLAVEQATVGQVILSEPALPLTVRGRGSATALPPTQEACGAEERLFLSPDEERQLRRLTRRLKGLSRQHRRLLRLLVDHEGEWLDVVQIAAWLSVHPSTVQNQPPHELLRMKLVARRRARGGAFVYTSQLAAYLQQQFPRLDHRRLQEQVLTGMLP